MAQESGSITGAGKSVSARFMNMKASRNSAKSKPAQSPSQPKGRRKSKSESKNMKSTLQLLRECIFDLWWLIPDVESRTYEKQSGLLIELTQLLRTLKTYGISPVIRYLPKNSSPVFLSLPENLQSEACLKAAPRPQSSTPA